MYKIDTKNGLPIEATSAGSTFENVVMTGYIDLDSVIDWAKVIASVVSQ